MKIKVVFPVVALVAALAASPVALADDLADGRTHYDGYINLPLSHAAVHGDIKEVRAQLAAGADVNAAIEYGSAALIAAAGMGQGEVVKILLAAGADVNAATNLGYTVLAVGGNHIEVVKILLAAGVDVNAADEYGRTALISAARWENDVEAVKAVKILLAAGADVNAASEWGRTALMWAAGSGHVEVVKILLAAGADVNAAADDSGETVLSLAEGKPPEPIIRNYSPGQYAHLLADIEAYKRELQGEPQNNLSAEDVRLFVAAKAGDAAQISELLSQGANINAIGEDGMSVLHYAAQLKNADLINILLQAGADPNVQNALGKNAVYLALSAGLLQLAGAMIEAGGKVEDEEIAALDSLSDEQKQEFAGVREDAERKRAEKESEKTATAEQPAETTAEQEPAEAAAETADSGLVKPADCKALFGDAEADLWMRDIVVDALAEKGIGCYSLSE